MTGAAMLGLASVSVTIEDTTVLRAIDLHVQKGEWVSVIGPNGAGKSTLLRAVTGAVPHRGAITVAGHELEERSRKERAREIAWVAQAPTIPVGMRVLDLVLLGRTPHLPPLGATSAHDLEIVGELLRDLDLEELADRYVDSLSGGERQRVLIARALAQQARILLLDEPTTALDLGHQQEVLGLLESLRRARGLTVVTTMHDLTLAAQYADRLVVLAEGAIVDEGTAREVLTAEQIRRYWSAEVEVMVRADGRIVVVPATSNDHEAVVARSTVKGAAS